MRNALQHNQFIKWLAGFFIAALSACSPLPNSSQVQHEGTKVSVANRRSSSLTVVFQSGLGDGMAVWSDVLLRLPSGLGFFAYDRPGYGGSGSKTGKRDPCSIARELHEVLSIAGVRPPYLLVGHSFGGIYQYAFAKLYPKDVSAILLVDATHPEHWENMQRRTPNTAAILLGLRTVAFSETEKQEFDAQAACISGLAKIDTHAIPARFLLRGKAGPFESVEFQSMSLELAARWSELLPGMTLSRVDGAGHHIQKDSPVIVVTEINALAMTAQADQR